MCRSFYRWRPSRNALELIAIAPADPGMHELLRAAAILGDAVLSVRMIPAIRRGMDRGPVERLARQRDGDVARERMLPCPESTLMVRLHWTTLPPARAIAAFRLSSFALSISTRTHGRFAVSLVSFYREAGFECERAEIVIYEPSHSWG